MHSHIDIKINGKSLVLPEDFSLSVEEKNPMFNDVSFFSYPVQVPVAGNLAVLKDIASRDSSTRAMDLERAEAQVTVDGIPLNKGQVITQDGSEIDKTFDLNIDAQQQSFAELIGDMNCQDVDISGKNILVGEKIGDVAFTMQYSAQDYFYLKDNDGNILQSGVCGKESGATWDDYATLDWREIRSDNQKYKADTVSGVMDAPQALGFSFPGRTQGFPLADRADGESHTFGGVEFYSPVVTKSFINVSLPYPHAPYCNARIAYPHPDVKTNSDGTQETDGIVTGNTHSNKEPRDYGQYWCLDANRQQSGLCFYVLYFLDCLFEQLGVAFDNSELREIEDLNRLCFFTTKHEYDSRVKSGAHLSSLAEINNWLRSRNCGGQLKFSFYTGEAKAYENNNENTAFQSTFNPLQKEYECNEYGVVNIDEVYYDTMVWPEGSDEIRSHQEYHRVLQGEVTCSTDINEMYANSKNFPKAAVSSVIKSLENSFGIRFLYDPDTRTVTARLLRNMYRYSDVRPLLGEVLSMRHVTEKITGVRVAYSQESAAKQQKANIIDGVRDYPTDYDYIEYPQGRTVINLDYTHIAQKVSANNMNVYVDLTTGNAYRVKVDSDAESAAKYRPVLFQVAQNKGVEMGDCSEKNADYVKELLSDFVPVPMNVINAKDYQDTQQSVAPVLAPLADVEMEHEYLEQRLQTIMFSDDLGRPTQAKQVSDLRSSRAFPSGLQLLGTMHMWLSENYDPAQTDNGNSPLQDIDWGLTVGIMRGAGAGTYGTIDGITEVDLDKFTDALYEFFDQGEYDGPFYSKSGAVVTFKALSVFKTLLDDGITQGTWTDETIINTEIGLTIGMLRTAITTANSNAVEMWTTSNIYLGGLVGGPLYNLVAGAGFTYYLINGIKVFMPNVKYTVNAYLDSLGDNVRKVNGIYNYAYLYEDLTALVEAGTISSDTMIYSRCNLTVGSLISYLSLIISYSGASWGSPYTVKSMLTREWSTYLETYLKGQGQYGTVGSSQSSSNPTGSQIINYERGYDGFDNSKWRQTVGVYAITSDLMDLKGAIFDYNGSDGGTGGGERFSLQVRAYKPFRYKYDSSNNLMISTDPQQWEDEDGWLIPCDDDERDSYGNITQRIRSRGWLDVFLTEHVRFLLERKLYKVRVLATIAQLMDIRNHWTDRYAIDGKTGWINRISYAVGNADGVGVAEIEFLAV